MRTGRAMIGILGGMGPQAGVLLAERLIALNPAARRDQDHPRVLLYSNSQVPDRSEAILRAGPSPVPEITASLRLLARAGADFAAIACNTAHVFLDDIRARAPLPVLDMIASVAARLACGNLRRVALLSTEGTAASGIYQRRLAAAGIEVSAPDPATQTVLSAAIYDPRRGIKARASPPDPQTLAQLWAVSERLLTRHRAEALLIGCTELSVAWRDPALASFPAVDALDELARACLARAGVAPAGRPDIPSLAAPAATAQLGHNQTEIA